MARFPTGIEMPVLITSVSSSFCSVSFVELYRYYANVFLHFEPLGYSYELQQDLKKKSGQTAAEQRQERARDAFHKALEKRQQTKRKSTLAKNDDIPHYVTPGTDQELRWRQEFIYQREPRKPFKPQMTT